jgi:putative transposase
MKSSRYTEEQIIGILKQHQAGLGAKELCRKYGISDATFYKWRSKYGGMEVSDARKLKALEEENRKLKKLLAETVLDAATLKEMLGKNFLSGVRAYETELGF